MNDNTQAILEAIERVVDDWDGNTDLLKPIEQILTAHEGESDKEITRRVIEEYVSSQKLPGENLNYTLPIWGLYNWTRLPTPPKEDE